MKILEVTDEAIRFDNGSIIRYDHYQDCCETNYADFCSTVTPDNIYYNHDFDKDLEFKAVDGMGFVFGDKEAKIFVPCYSEQNGYYSSDIDIYYNGKNVLTFDAEFVDDYGGEATEYPVNFLPETDED